MINIDINTRITQVRTIFNKTQTNFSKELGVTQGIISKVENLKVPATDDLIKKIEEVYSISANWILTGEWPIFYIDDSIKNNLFFHLQNNYNLSEADILVIEKFVNLEKHQREIIHQLFSDDKTP